MIGCAMRFHFVGKRLELIHDRRDPRLRGVGAIAPVAVHGVVVVGAEARVGVGDLVGRRRRRIAVAVAEKNRSPAASMMWLTAVPAITDW